MKNLKSLLPLLPLVHTSFVLALYLFSFCLIPLSARATGTPTAQFLEMMPSARGTALGGAYVALVDDASAMAWNPAGLARIRGGSLHALYQQHIESITFQYLSGGLAMPGLGVFGAQVFMLNSGNISETTEDSNGGFVDRGTVFQVTDVAFGGGWGFDLFSGFHIGLGAKWFQQQIATFAQNGLAFDAGFQWVLMNEVRAGGSLQHFGTMVNGEPLPTTWRMGAACDLMPGLLVVGEAAQTLNAPLSWRGGVEYTLLELLALRGGYQTGLGTGGTSGLTAGFGLSVMSFVFDYAYAPLGDLGISHRLSGSLKF